jgi:hypothetical protein
MRAPPSSGILLLPRGGVEAQAALSFTWDTFERTLWETYTFGPRAGTALASSSSRPSVTSARRTTWAQPSATVAVQGRPRITARDCPTRSHVLLRVVNS